MKAALAERRTERVRSRWTSRARRLWPWSVLLPLALLLAYLAWPYLTLWRLDRALAHHDDAALADLVDIPAVRAEIRRRLNKESESLIGPVSDRFIAWLEQAIRRNGTQALSRQVDLDWVRRQLLAGTRPGGRLQDSVTHAFFADPLHFRVQIVAPGEPPVRAVLGLRLTGWRIVALSQ